MIVVNGGLIFTRQLIPVFHGHIRFLTEQVLSARNPQRKIRNEIVSVLHHDIVDLARDDINIADSFFAEQKIAE